MIYSRAGRTRAKSLRPGKPTPKAQTGRGPERGEGNGGRRRPAFTTRAGWAPETAARQLASRCLPTFVPGIELLGELGFPCPGGPLPRAPAAQAPGLFHADPPSPRTLLSHRTRGAKFAPLGCFYAVGSKRNLDDSSQRSPEKPRNP